MTRLLVSKRLRNGRTSSASSHPALECTTWKAAEVESRSSGLSIRRGARDQRSLSSSFIKVHCGLPCEKSGLLGKGDVSSTAPPLELLEVLLLPVVPVDE